MAELTVKFVRPDKVLYEGRAGHMVLATYTGELGVWPGHASEICALGNGVTRITQTEEGGGKERGVVVSGGYAEIHNDTVVVIADHARAVDDIEPDVVQATRDKAVASRDALPEGDHNRAYYENKIAWCDLLLRTAGVAAKTGAAE